MRIETKRAGRTLVVRCEGELDLCAASQFRDAVEERLSTFENISNLIVNLSGVNFVDSSGLGAILGRYKHIRQRGGEMGLAELQPAVQKTCELAGLFKIMKIHRSEEDALRVVQGG